MLVCGFSIAKNCIKFAYPIKESILQNRLLLDRHYIGVPKLEQDDDNTRQHIINICEKENITYSMYSKGSNAYLQLYELNWPGKNIAWSTESLDKILQKEMLDNIDMSKFSWVYKTDIDEFINDKDSVFLKELMETLVGDENIGTISLNYLQFCGSLRYTIYDPTNIVIHIGRPNNISFIGNDAMQLVDIKNRQNIHITEIPILHIGYAKDPMLIATRIREHLVLNASMYPNAVHNATKWKNYKFEFPTHKKSAKLWPIAISDAPNETEYTPVNLDSLPSVLKEKIQEFDFYVPTNIK